VAIEHVRTFAPGRVNLIGEHTDYNCGLALPFAIAEGITVSARRSSDPARARTLEVTAHDLGEHDEFMLGKELPAGGWRACVRGIAAELREAGTSLAPATIEVRGELPPGAGLSSSAALEVALCLALLELADRAPAPPLDGIQLAQLCARVENRWVGAQTGLLDQIACLFGAADHAVLIDFRSLETDSVPLVLDGWQLVVLDSGERHEHASSGYNARRAECRRACELLGVRSLREIERSALKDLPGSLRLRAMHVLSENERVQAAVECLGRGDLPAVGRLLDESHASLQDLYEVSTPALDRAAERLRRAGAAGARMLGGGFGGSVLGLFPPGREPPGDARAVRPSAGARVLEPAHGAAH